MTYYKKKYQINKSNFKNSSYYANSNISLPVYPGLKNQEIQKIIKTVIKFYDHKK